MRKRKVVKIDEKEYTIKELSVQDIIDLTSGNSFLSGALLKESSSAGQDTKGGNLNMDGFNSDVAAIMAKCCDFSIADVKKMAPSEIRLLYDAFNEVNADFLAILKTLGIADILVHLKEAVLSGFSKQLATSLKAAM